MKYAAILLLFLILGLSACSRAPATPSVGDIQTAIAKTQASAPIIPTIEPTNSPVPQSPTKTLAPTARATSTPVEEPTNAAPAIADTGARFNFAEVSGVAHLENGYFLVTLEVPGNLEGDYFAVLGEDEFDCLVLSDYPNRLYCTGLTSQAGTFVKFELFALGEDQPVFEEELGIPPVDASENIQARIKRDERNASEENPPADSVPYPYPYP
jgi:hypothetical protein